MRNSCFLPPGAVVLIGDFCSRLSNEVFDELERMTKALQLLYWLHVCSRCGFILASQQWETAQVYDEILDVTLGDDITFGFLSACRTPPSSEHFATQNSPPSNGQSTGDGLKLSIWSENGFRTASTLKAMFGLRLRVYSKKTQDLERSKRYFGLESPPPPFSLSYTLSLPLIFFFLFFFYHLLTWPSQTSGISEWAALPSPL